MKRSMSLRGVRGHVIFLNWTTNITIALYNFIHNDIQLKTLRWIQQQQKINKETKGERTHL